MSESSCAVCDMEGEECCCCDATATLMARIVELESAIGETLEMDWSYENHGPENATEKLDLALQGKSHGITELVELVNRRTSQALEAVRQRDEALKELGWWKSQNSCVRDMAAPCSRCQSADKEMQRLEEVIAELREPKKMRGT